MNREGPWSQNGASIGPRPAKSTVCAQEFPHWCGKIFRTRKAGLSGVTLFAGGRSEPMCQACREPASRRDLWSAGFAPQGCRPGVLPPVAETVPPLLSLPLSPGRFSGPGRGGGKGRKGPPRRDPRPKRPGLDPCGAAASACRRDTTCRVPTSAAAGKARERA